jgi:hypothetical protein
VPFGPANPRVLSDPSGIGNASMVPALPGPNLTPVTPPVVYGPNGSSPSRVVTPPYPSASERIISEIPSRKRGHRHRPRSRPQVSKFTGICRGC